MKKTYFHLVSVNNARIISLILTEFLSYSFVLLVITTMQPRLDQRVLKVGEHRVNGTMSESIFKNCG